MSEYKLKDVVHETAGFWVLRVAKGFELYRKGVTHSTRCGTFGPATHEYETRAIAECDRRQALLDRAALRKYNLIVINLKTRRKRYLNASPLTHAEGSTMLSKFTDDYPQLVRMVEEVGVPVNPDVVAAAFAL